MQIADKYYLNYLAKFIADNRYYRDNFEKIIDYRDKKYCTDNGNPTHGCCLSGFGRSCVVHNVYSLGGRLSIISCVTTPR